MPGLHEGRWQQVQHNLGSRRTGDVAIEVDEGREVLELLTHDEAQCSEHGHAAVGDLQGGGGEGVL